MTNSNTFEIGNKTNLNFQIFTYGYAKIQGYYFHKYLVEHSFLMISCGTLYFDSRI